MLWVVIWGPGTSDESTALIGDFSVASASPSIAAKPTKVPKALSTGGAGSLAVGLEPDSVRYYEPATGRAFVADLRDAKLEVLSDRKLSGFMASVWIPGTDRVISSFDQKGAIEYRYFDYGTDEVKVIGSAVTALDTSPDGRQVAFVEGAQDSMTLFVADSDGSAPRRILMTRMSDVQLSWPSAELLALSSRRPDRTGWELTFVRMDGTLEVMLSGRENLEYTWSRDGSKLLFSFFLPGEGVALWYHDIGQAVDVPLGLSTSAKKCAWHPSGSVVTCGVPSKNNLSQDVPADRVATTDDIITLDISSGMQTTNYTAQTGTLLGVINPLISSSGRYVAFPNMFDNRLYFLEL